MNRAYLFYFPYIYTLLTRIYVNGRVSSYYLTDFIILLPTILFHSRSISEIASQFYISQVLLALVASVAMAYLYYEGLYVLNDVIASQREDLPTFRGPRIKADIAIGLRWMLFTLLSYILWQHGILRLPLVVVYVVMLLSIIGLAHNLQRRKLMRTPTHALMRVLRWILITAFYVNFIGTTLREFAELSKDVLMCLLPHIVYVELGYFTYNLEKLGLNVPKVRQPLLYSYGIWIPLLWLLLSNPVLQLTGYFALVIISIIKNVKMWLRATGGLV